MQLSEKIKRELEMSSDYRADLCTNIKQDD